MAKTTPNEPEDNDVAPDAPTPDPIESPAPESSGAVATVADQPTAATAAVTQSSRGAFQRGVRRHWVPIVVGAAALVIGLTAGGFIGHAVADRGRPGPWNEASQIDQRGPGGPSGDNSGHENRNDDRGDHPGFNTPNGGVPNGGDSPRDRNGDSNDGPAR